jgi:hypothetical protein
MQAISDATETMYGSSCPPDSVHVVESKDATSTPPRNRETRRAKRTRTCNADALVDDDHSVIGPYGVASRPTLQDCAKQLFTWLASLGHHHPSCKAIPSDAVVRLSLATMR